MIGARERPAKSLPEGRVSAFPAEQRGSMDLAIVAGG